MKSSMNVCEYQRFANTPSCGLLMIMFSFLVAIDLFLSPPCGHSRVIRLVLRMKQFSQLSEAGRPLINRNTFLHTEPQRHPACYGADLKPSSSSLLSQCVRVLSDMPLVVCFLLLDIPHSHAFAVAKISLSASAGHNS